VAAGVEVVAAADWPLDVSLVETVVATDEEELSDDEPASGVFTVTVNCRVPEFCPATGLISISSGDAELD
jgi:hypothetical protein